MDIYCSFSNPLIRSFDPTWDIQESHIAAQSQGTNKAHEGKAIKWPSQNERHKASTEDLLER